MTFFSESDDYREGFLNIQMSQVNVDKQYNLNFTVVIANIIDELLNQETFY